MWNNRIPKHWTWNITISLRLKHFPTSSFIHAAIIELTGLSGSTNLYCSSMNVIETVATPMIFCTFQGYLILLSSLHLWHSIVCKGDIRFLACTLIFTRWLPLFVEACVKLYTSWHASLNNSKEAKLMHLYKAWRYLLGKLQRQTVGLMQSQLIASRDVGQQFCYKTRLLGCPSRWYFSRLGNIVLL